MAYTEIWSRWCDEQMFCTNLSFVFPFSQQAEPLLIYRRLLCFHTSGCLHIYIVFRASRKHCEDDVDMEESLFTCPLFTLIRSGVSHIASPLSIFWCFSERFRDILFCTWVLCSCTPLHFGSLDGHIWAILRKLYISAMDGWVWGGWSLLRKSLTQVVAGILRVICR